jgi:UDP-N-acetylglucosamine:LPS N-acetylglucosamine transferase
VGANIFGDPLLKGVIARGGWGSIWECLANNKPIALARTMYEEDPEMGHTQKTMAALGLAAILDGAADTFLINSTREKIISAMKRERAADLKEFGNYANDGYGYIASKIHEKYDL